jgi:hypothetical protein
MIQCKNCGCYPKGNECHICNTKAVEVKEKPRYKKIRYRTAKRAREESKYQVRRIIFLLNNPKCAVFPQLRATEVHHQKGRIGDLLLDERFWLPVSQKAHDKITRESAWAEENGYTLSRLAIEK